MIRERYFMNGGAASSAGLKGWAGGPGFPKRREGGEAETESVVAFAHLSLLASIDAGAGEVGERVTEY